MQYKGMVARIDYIVRAACFVGEIINCDDVISFSAVTLSELQQAMQFAVDEYFKSLRFKLVQVELECLPQQTKVISSNKSG